MSDITGMFGYKQFDLNRTEILHEMDKVLAQIADRPMKTEHGDALEAFVRKWLSEFLPQKYAVTSGYVIPNIYAPAMKSYHYDVIIYNQLDAPVLWIQETTDQSEQGKYRAIPAKYVVAIYEVKAQMTQSAINGAIDKLSEANEYSSELPDYYHSGVIFGYLKQENRNKSNLLDLLSNAIGAFGFKNGLVLRYTGDSEITGHIKTRPKGKDEPANRIEDAPIVRPRNEMGEIITDSNGYIQIKDSYGGSIVHIGNGKYGVTRSYGQNVFVGDECLNLSWSIDNFANFSIHLLINLDGNNAPVQDFSFGKMFEKVL
jgi:hypothetical protein